MLFRSTDGAYHWNVFDDGLPDSGHVIAIAIDALRHRVFASGSSWKDAGLYVYDTMVSADSVVPTIPSSFVLSQNYPNPFNPTTTLEYALPQPARVQLKIYNVVGQQIATVVDGEQEAGHHTVNFDAREFSSGVYFYRLHAGTYSDIKKMLLLK